MALILLFANSGSAASTTAAPDSYKLEIAFANSALDSSYTWTDVSSYLIDGQTQRGRSRALERTQAGTATFTLDNSDRRFEPGYAASPYSPNLLPLKPIRFSVVYQGITYPVWSGFVERWTLAWPNPYESTVKVECVDAFELLNWYQLNRPLPSVTFDSNVTFTQVPNIYTGDIYVETKLTPSVDDPLRPSFNTAASPYSLTVYLPHDDANNVTCTWGDVVSVCQSAQVLSQYVTTLLVPGVDGTATAKQKLSGTISSGGFTGTTAGARIAEVLSDMGWTQGAALDPGLSAIQRSYFSTTDGQVALQHLQDVVDTELGFLFVSATGAIVFQDRYYRQKYATSQVTFGDGTSEIPYEAIGEPVLDRDEVWNEARITRQGGTLTYDVKKRPVFLTQTTTQTVKDATSQSKYGPRVQARTTLHTTDTAALGMAQFLVNAYKDPILNLRQFLVRPLKSQTSWLAVLKKVGLGSRVTVNRTPPNHGASSPGTPISSTLTVSGNEITDASRAAATAGDGRTADSSFGIWEATTNLVENGGLETNASGWYGQASSAILSADFEQGTNGNTIATSDAGSLSAWNAVTVGTGATVAYDNTHADGALAAKIATGGTASNAYLEWSLSTVTNHYGAIELYMTANPSATVVPIRCLSGTSGAASLRIRTDGKLELVDQIGNVFGPTTNAISLNTLIRIEFHFIHSTTVGQMELRLFNDPTSATPTETFTTAANKNTLASIDKIRFGIANSAGVSNIGPLWLDNIVANGTSYNDVKFPVLARTSSQAKFGSNSLSTVVLAGAGQGARYRASTAAVSGNTYGGSVWVNAPNGMPLVLALATHITGEFATQAFTGTGAWQRVTVIGAANSNNALRLIVRNPTSSQQAGTFYTDGAQIEAKVIATPYVETTTATASRSAARVRLAAAQADETTFWAAFRIRYGFPSTGPPGSNPYLLDWRDDANNLLGLYLDKSTLKWTTTRLAASVGASAQSAAQTFSSGDTATVIAAFTSTQVAISVSGGAFTAVSNSSVPTLAASLADIASQGGSASHFDGEVLWATFGTGTITDAGAATLNGYGNTDPTIAQAVAVDSNGATTTLWTADTSAITYEATDVGFTQAGYVEQISHQFRVDSTLVDWTTSYSVSPPNPNYYAYT